MKKRVLVAMSGGVDSSVTAALLHNEGYEVVGITMKTWDYGTKTGGCCNLMDINDAREVAVTLGFPHFIVDIRDTFRKFVVENFIEEYIAGRTPNPCIRCNTYIKWDALLKQAKQLGCEYIATGHYAKIRKENDRYIISQAEDSWKDQTYVLWGLTQDVLDKTLFPLGNYTKPEIRKMAEEMGFVRLSKKKDSYDICFVPEGDYRKLLQKERPEIKNLPEGKFVLEDGTVVGTHTGYLNYTIGQRKGLPALGKPYYVIDIVPQTNTVVIAEKDKLLKTKMLVKDVNLIKYAEIPEEGLEVITKIRYKDKGTHSRIYKQGDKILVEFYAPVSAITPGQATVFYEDKDVVGGGWIEKSVVN